MLLNEVFKYFALFSYLDETWKTLRHFHEENLAELGSFREAF